MAVASGVSTASSSTASSSARAAAEQPPQGVPEGMVALPEGIFLMGAFAAVGNPEEHPAHEAIVPALYVDKMEVTVGAYKKCVAAGGCQPAHNDHRFCDYEADDKDNYPINCVDLYQASAFCRWAGKRLPSEREWEYAGAGGSRRRPFSWGLAKPRAGKNACYDHPGGGCPVGSFEPGAFGLYDMTGNVWEWTASRFERYPSSPLGDEISGSRPYVYRGGSWSRRFAKWMRTTLRNRYAADKYSASMGMRCVQTVKPLKCPPQTQAMDGVCVRSEGEPICEPRYGWDGKKCRLGGGSDPAARVALAPKAAGTNAAAASGTKVAPKVSASAAGPIRVSRSRTPQHDADCKRHWPKTPASYLFKGGPNYPSRKPIVRAAGCVPRDMSWGWTSACCRE